MATGRWPDGTTHEEHFSGMDREAARQDDAFEVEIASTGEVLTVPADRSLLEMPREAGHPVDAACEYGACGRCVVGVEDGESVHCDVCRLPETRATRMTTCVSRGKGRVRLTL